jgi:hypothetical protein
MRGAVTSGRSFDGQSPVSAYWLQRCEGFAVCSGRRRGNVEGVTIDAEAMRAASVVVRYGAFRTRVVPVEAVDAVVPADRLLVLRTSEHRAGRAPALRRAALVAAAASVNLARALGRALVGVGRVSLPAARRFLATSWSATRRFVRWLSPRAVRAGRAAARAAALLALSIGLGLAVLIRGVRVYAPPAGRAIASAGAVAVAAATGVIDMLAAAWQRRRAARAVRAERGGSSS